MNPTTQDFGPCPCGDWKTAGAGHGTTWRVSEGGPVMGCGVEGTKLTRYGHLVGCTCRSCLGRRNRRKGQATEAKRHRRLGGQGQTPRDELAFSYSLNVTTEDKGGQQIPAAFTKFIGGKWFKDALRQAEKKLPIGSDSLPSLWLDCGRQGTWLVVRVPEKGLR